VFVERGTPRLAARFAVYAAVALIAASGGIFLYLRSALIRQGEAQELAHASFIGDVSLRLHLRASDFHQVASGDRLVQLDRVIRGEAMSANVLKAKLYNSGGLVVWSSDHSLIGKRAGPDHLVAAAAAGHPVTDLSMLNEEGGTGPDRRVLETYAPVRLGPGRPSGVFEMYEDYAPILANATGTFVPAAGVIALVLIGLYMSFFPILRRVTSRLHRQIDTIEHQSLHDTLTGLPNRGRMGERLAQAIAAAESHGDRFAVLFIDLDRFQEINDTLGHQTGDRLLQLVANRLRSAVSAGDTVARVGGDKFAILKTDVDGPADALTLAANVRGRLLVVHDLDGIELETDASIGVALYPDDGSEVDLLLRRSALAAHVAKETHLCTLYAPEHDHYSPARLALIGRLRRAIASDELVVHYQPQAELPGGTIRGVEALVRWQHPERGLLGPDAFVPIAERIGLIRPLTTFVLDTALRQCAAWRAAGLDLGVAVNITGRDLLDQMFADEVSEFLQRWQVSPERLELEITESTVLNDAIRARHTLDRLSELGVSLAIDDYGTGNSSLAHLKRLPVNVLKIDKSFVLRMSEDADDAVIVRSTIDLGHNLGLRVLAEGIEDEHAWQELARLGCDMAQGYYLGRPVPPDEIAALARVLPPLAVVTPLPA
jgi:diguanylate cyclase (GGDEF)-like protein